MPTWRCRAERVGLVALALCAGACRDTTVDATLAASVSGVVQRGPITPVCQAGVSCDAPFSAGFSVRQRDQVVARFRSNSDGTFSVRVPIGELTIVPDADAPIISASAQAKSVTVPAAGLTGIVWQFDTGIR